MAGTIIADFIRTDANQLSLNVGNTTFATINASGFFSNTGTQLIAANGKISGASVIASSIPGTAFATAAIPSTKIGTGAVLQVVQSVKTDTTSTTSTSFSDITGLSVTITPTSATSKFYIVYNTHIGLASGAYSGGIKLVRNSTDIYLGDAAGSRIRASNWAYSDYYNYAYWQCPGAYLDSPATTSAVTYKLQLASGYSGTTVSLNYNYINGDNSYTGRAPSHITVMEIAG
jgi:hypothetical protein